MIFLKSFLPHLKPFGIENLNRSETLAWSVLQLQLPSENLHCLCTVNRMGFKFVVVDRINRVNGLTGFSKSKMLWAFDRINKVTARHISSVCVLF